MVQRSQKVSAASAENVDCVLDRPGALEEVELCAGMLEVALAAARPAAVASFLPALLF